MPADPDLPETCDLFLMAVALHGSSPEVVRGEQRVTANGRPIVRQVLMWLGLWNEETRIAAYGDGDGPIVLDLSKTLIGMCRLRSEDKFIVGYGSFARERDPPLPPTYAAFGLTERGRAHAESLFKRYPGYGSFKEQD